MMDQKTQAEKWTKLLTFFLGAGIVLVVLVFFATSTDVTFPGASVEQDVLVADATPSVPYRHLRWRLDGPNSLVTSDLARLRAGLPKLTDKVVQTESQKIQALSKRSERRAFDGAPPVVPHHIVEQDAASCLTCHGSGVLIEGLVAPVTSHLAYTNCTQCHVSSLPPDDGSVTLVANSFVGISSAKQGERAWQGAPPSFPHGVWMRQDCSSCHGVTGRTGIRTTHPDRLSCQQCHVPVQSEQPWAD